MVRYALTIYPYSLCEFLIDAIVLNGLYVYTASTLYTLVAVMRTNIVIDDELMSDALKLTGLRNKREAVELGLKTLINLKKQEKIKRFRGKLHWEGDLEGMRSDN